MNYTRPPKSLTLKQFLHEDEDDMFAGVKSVLQDIRYAWSGGSRSKVERSRRTSLKKLDDAGRTKLTRVCNAFISQSISNLNAKPAFKTVTTVIGNHDEALAAGSVFIDLANPIAPDQSKIADLARYFTHYAVQDGAITQERADTLYNFVLSKTDRVVGQDVVELFSKNAKFFLSVFALDQDLGVHPNQGAELLHQKLKGTQDEGANTREKAVVMVVNGLQRFRLICAQMIEGIQAEGKGRVPPKEPAATHPASPNGNKQPATNGTGGPSASMQPKVAAAQAAATQATGAAMIHPRAANLQTIDTETATKIEAALHQASTMTPDQIKKARARIAALPASFNGVNWQKGFQQISKQFKAGMT